VRKKHGNILTTRQGLKGRRVGFRALKRRETTAEGWTPCRKNHSRRSFQKGEIGKELWRTRSSRNWKGGVNPSWRITVGKCKGLKHHKNRFKEPRFSRKIHRRISGAVRTVRELLYRRGQESKRVCRMTKKGISERLRGEKEKGLWEGGRCD